MGQETNGTTNGATATLTRKDFVTDQEVRWCPGCGDSVSYTHLTLPTIYSV